MGTFPIGFYNKKKCARGGVDISSSPPALLLKLKKFFSAVFTYAI